MNSGRTTRLSAVAAFGLASAALVALPGAANAVTAKQLVGTWRLVSTTNINAAGVKVEPFGLHPLGSVTFDALGHFTQVIASAEPPTPANKGQQHVIAEFGTYSVKDGGKTLAIHIIGSSTQSLDGKEADRSISRLANGDMKIQNSSASAHSVGTAHVEAIWARAR